MELKIKLPENSIAALKKSIEDKLQVAAIKGWERAVELSPAAGETPYATGQMRQSLRVQKTGEQEYTIFCPMSYGVFVEFGTGPKGKATGAIPDFENDPQPSIPYHTGEVLVTRRNGELLDEPYIRHTQGMQAQPFLRPALQYALKTFIDLMNEKQ